MVWVQRSNHNTMQGVAIFWVREEQIKQENLFGREIVIQNII